MNTVNKLTLEQRKQLRHAVLTEDGKEIHNPLPVHASVTPRPETMQEKVARLLQLELSRRAELSDMETFDEANDFDLVDEFDFEPTSPYEMVEEEFLPEPEGEVAEQSTEPKEPAGDPVPVEPQTVEKVAE